VQESTVANSGPNETSPTIAFDGSVVGVAYGFHNGANSSLRFRPFTAAGAPLANPKDVTTADVGQGAIASSNDGFTIVHVLGQFQSAGAETFAIDVTGAPTSAGVMALAPTEPIGALAFTDDGTHYAIVYQAAAATVATGDRTTANPPHALGTRNPETLDVVSAPGGFAVAWIEDGELLFARVDVAGVLATPVFHLAGDAHGAALAALGGTTFAAVYGDAGGQLLLVVFDA